MNKTGYFILASLYLLCFLSANLTGSIWQTSKVEYTHTHNHDDDHHHEHADHDEPANNHKEQPHQHETLISSQQPFLHSEFLAHVVRLELAAPHSDFDQNPPQTPYIFGIFRPPINV
ncbi:MAG: hypothetical protein AABZ31_14540 [Bdellovibrionota bacterium]